MASAARVSRFESAMSERGIVATSVLIATRIVRVESPSVLFRPVPLRRFCGSSGGDAARTLRARPILREESWT
jgi:hypothetical protein